MITTTFNFIKNAITSIYSMMNNCLITISPTTSISIFKLDILLALYVLIIHFILKLMKKEVYDEYNFRRSKSRKSRRSE